jgi:hypothetical protein
MTKRRLIRGPVIVLAVVASAGLVAAQRPRSSSYFSVYGLETQSCGAWLALPNKASSPYGWWLTGFVSGAGYATPYDMRRSDRDGLMSWVDKYCAERPLDPLASAAIALAKELGAVPTPSP